LVEKLLSHGADPLLIDDAGNTLLHEAATFFGGSQAEISLIERLIELGIPVDAGNIRGQTAAHLAGPVIPTDPNRRLYERCTRRTPISVLSQLGCSFDPNARDMNGFTPLHYACVASESIAFDLLRAGADMNAKCNSSRTPLHCTARGRQPGIIAMLLHLSTEWDRELDVDATDKAGRTPLHDACRSGCLESVRLLIDAGADIHRQDCSSVTPSAASAEFADEDRLWRSKDVTNCQPNDVGFIASGDYRFWLPSRPKHVPSDSDYRSPGVAALSKLLVRAGASADGVLDAAGKPDMEAALRQDAEGKIVDDAKNFAATPVSLSTRDNAAVFDGDLRQRPVENVTDLIRGIDEAAFDALLAKGLNVVQPRKPQADYHGDLIRDFTPLSTLARLGLTDCMAKVVTKAKLLDDFAFVKSIAESANWISCRVQPVLQAACSRSIWTMDMVRLLVHEGQVDVNAREHIISEPVHKLPHQGGTALHVLADGDFWWQVEAIKFLVQNGKLARVLTIPSFRAVYISVG
jgi:ankyrin repeat protein